MSEGIEQSIDLGTTREQLWDLLMDPNRLGEWVGPHRSIKDVPDLPLGEGDRFRQKLGFGPISFKVKWEVVQLNKPEFTRWVGTGPGGSRAEVVYTLSELEGGAGTRFDYCNDYELPGGVMGRAAKRAFSSATGAREARKSLQRLQDHFGEGGSS